MSDFTDIDPEYPEGSVETDDTDPKSLDGSMDAGQIDSACHRMFEELVENHYREISVRRRDALVYDSLLGLITVILSQQAIIDGLSNRMASAEVTQSVMESEARGTQSKVDHLNLRAIIEKVEAHGGVQDGLKLRMDLMDKSFLGQLESTFNQIQMNSQFIGSNNTILEMVRDFQKRLGELEKRVKDGEFWDNAKIR